MVLLLLTAVFPALAHGQSCSDFTGVKTEVSTTKRDSTEHQSGVHGGEHTLTNDIVFSCVYKNPASGSTCESTCTASLGGGLTRPLPGENFVGGGPLLKPHVVAASAFLGGTGPRTCAALAAAVATGDGNVPVITVT